ncbi:hypothetical protein KDW_47100 [Dictyobacter vulcani]|uniref:Uncharacterized protein n=1 Tax=Dictyobacter vulcani TaxID=2607529 RepID=A0A5J4KLF9_9CHLR|nr:DrmB family protein [Dictyobacter vulcani]GER90548.1 hypothetical protein KDW_47100 [Dictyobacter vulcani]
MAPFIKKHPVGELRPSQLILSYGVGAIVDLPHMSTLIMGIDDWDTRTSEEIIEPRLLEAIQSVMGPQVKHLLTPSTAERTGKNPSYVGVPVAAFPRWMVCPSCRLLASVDDGFFKLKSYDFHPDRTSYRHENCPKGKNPIVVPSRFLIACTAGHLDDFPWHHFIHGPAPCKASLYMSERGITGEPSDIRVECRTCKKSRIMSEAFAFTTNEEKSYTPTCTGRRPHLRQYAKKSLPAAGQDHPALSLKHLVSPGLYLALDTEGEDQLAQLIEDHWSILQAASNQEMLKIYMQIPHIQEKLGEYSLETIWQAIAKKNQDEPTAIVRPRDLKLPSGAY